MRRAKLTYGYTSLLLAVLLALALLELLHAHLALRWSLAAGRPWSTEINSGKNRLIATGLTPKVIDVSTTPSSAGAPGPPTPKEGVRAPAEIGDRCFWRSFCIL